MAQYCYRVFGAEFGPISLESLQQEIANGELSGAQEIRCWGETNWTRIADFIVEGNADQNSTNASDRSILERAGGHDAIETAVTVCDVPAITTVDRWFCRGSRVECGPHTMEELRSLARSGQLLAIDELSLWAHGPWATVGSIGHLMSEMSEVLVESPGTSSLTPNAGSGLGVEASLPVPVQQQPDLGAVAVRTGWYARMGQVERGPMEFQKLLDLASAGHILPIDRVRQADQSGWTLAREIPGLFSSNSNHSPVSRIPARPSVSFPQGGYSLQTARSRPIIPASVQPAAHLPLPAISPSPKYSISLQPDSGAVHLRSTPPQTMIGSSGRSESRLRTIEAAPERPQRRADEEGSGDVEFSSEQPIRQPPQHGDGVSKHKLRRGLYQEPQLLDRRNVIVASIVGAVVLLLFGWSPFPPTVDQLEAPYSELKTYLDILDEKWMEKPTIEFWELTRKEVVHKIESAKQKVKNVNLRHQVRDFEIAAAECMLKAAKANNFDTVPLRLNQARYFLELSRKYLDEAAGLAEPDPPIQVHDSDQDQ